MRRTVPEGEHYSIDDLILPTLRMDDPCEIRIDISEQTVRLTVGRRDWEWLRGKPEPVAMGTDMDEKRR